MPHTANGGGGVIDRVFCLYETMYGLLCATSHALGLEIALSTTKDLTRNLRDLSWDYPEERVKSLDEVLKLGEGMY